VNNALYCKMLERPVIVKYSIILLFLQMIPFVQHICTFSYTVNAILIFHLCLQQTCDSAHLYLYKLQQQLDELQS